MSNKEPGVVKVFLAIFGIMFLIAWAINILKGTHYEWTTPAQTVNKMNYDNHERVVEKLKKEYKQ